MSLVLSENAMRRVVDMTREWERYGKRLILSLTPVAAGPRLQDFRWYGMTTTAVTARSGPTPGSGTVQRYLFNGTDFKTKVGDPVKVFNRSQQTIASGFAVSVETLDGSPFFYWGDCKAG